jgi:polyisoprenoid-binding protein YceI
VIVFLNLPDLEAPLIKQKHALFVFFSLFFFQTVLHAGTYKIDDDHSAVSFKIRHLVSYVRGNFNTFEGTFEYEPGNPESWSANAVIQADSIDTHVAARDKHLRSADFFDAEQFPTLTFESTSVSAVTNTAAKVQGILTIHGVGKPVELDLEIHGTASDPWGNISTAFTATTTVNRKDFGLEWNKPLETGQLLVGEEVEITLDIAGFIQE